MQLHKHDVLYSEVSLSFWGGIDPSSGEVIDQTHPLHGECVTDKILCIPSGRGSCTGSQVMLELILNGKAPKAVILRDADAILCTGGIIADEFFNEEVDMLPYIVAVGGEVFAELRGSHYLEVGHNNSNGQQIVTIRSKNKDILADDLLNLPLGDTLYLDEKEMDIDQGRGDARNLALSTIRRIAAIYSATKMIPIKSAHIDGVTFIGQGGLRFAQKLVELGGKVSVPTTLNSQSVDRRRWEMLGVDEKLAANANAVGDAYLSLGCEMSFTCAPYLLPSAPRLGDQIMWGESNAVVYSNSVIGARTEKYADYFDICAAIVGLVPEIGVHLDSQRQPGIIIDTTKLIEKHILPSIVEDSSDDGTELESLFPLLGWTIGNLSSGKIPLILGMDLLPIVSDDNLKSFCAAFGTTGKSPLFHMAKVTPEAVNDDILKGMVDGCRDNVEVTIQDLSHAHAMLDSGKNNHSDSRVDLVALGNPHLSISELKRLTDLLHQNGVNKVKVDVVATLSRHVQSLGLERGYIKKLEEYGVQLINDTCWCMICDPPIIPVEQNARILTNSGKYAHYGPGLTNRKIRFGSMFDCVQAAKTGELRLSIPSWLPRKFASTLKRIK
uniref:DUF521 domain-containing protein n=1 Tax=Chaetoceros debilis TaxID=122233 RepID=A0A7S3V6S8_9STRA